MLTISDGYESWTVSAAIVSDTVYFRRCWVIETNWDGRLIPSTHVHIDNDKLDGRESCRSDWKEDGVPLSFSYWRQNDQAQLIFPLDNGKPGRQGSLRINQWQMLVSCCGLLHVDRWREGIQFWEGHFIQSGAATQLNALVPDRGNATPPHKEPNWPIREHNDCKGRNWSTLIDQHHRNLDLLMRYSNSHRVALLGEEAIEFNSRKLHITSRYWHSQIYFTCQLIKIWGDLCSQTFDPLIISQLVLTSLRALRLGNKLVAMTCWADL